MVQCKYHFRAHESAVTSVAFDDIHRMIVTGSDDCTARLFTLRFVDSAGDFFFVFCNACVCMCTHSSL